MRMLYFLSLGIFKIQNEFSDMIFGNSLFLHEHKEGLCVIWQESSCYKCFMAKWLAWLFYLIISIISIKFENE